MIAQLPPELTEFWSKQAHNCVDAGNDPALAADAMLAAAAVWQGQLIGRKRAARVLFVLAQKLFMEAETPTAAGVH